MTRVLQQVALRYKNNPNFLGSLGRDPIKPTSFVTNPNLALAQYDQLKRVARAVKSVAPALAHAPAPELAKSR